MNWPQLIMIIFLALTWAGNLYKWGKKGDYGGVGQEPILAFLMYQGGFWS